MTLLPELAEQMGEKQELSLDIYKHIIELSPIGIILVRSGKILFINRRGAELLGRTVESVIGHEFLELVYSRDRKLFQKDGGPREWTEAGFISGDGKVIVLETRVREVGLGDERAGLIVLSKFTGEFPITLENVIRCRTLVEKLADVVFVLDSEGKFVFLNQEFTKVTGYTREEWIGRSFTEIIAPEYIDLIPERCRKGLSPESGVSRYEVEIVDYVGNRIPVEVRVTFLTDADGNEVGRIGLARDVSERREFEWELKRKNEELEMILNTMGEGVVVLDHQHRMLSLNKKACELFGYKPEEIIGKDYTFWCHPDSLKTLTSKLAEREKGKSATYEVRFLRKGGGSFYSQVTAVPIFNESGVFQGSIGCLRDITQERKLSSRVRELNEFNRRLIELADVWINVVDTDGRILLWNNEAERISGYTRDEVMNNSMIWEWLYPDPDYRTRIWERQKLMRREDAHTRRAETTIVTKSGEKRVISWHGRPLHLANGRRGWLVVGHDVTEERRREKRLREYAAEIEQLSKERKRIFSMAAHELRTPLTVIRGFIDLVQYSGNLSDKQRGWLNKAREETDHLGRLVTQLLEVARLDKEGSRLSPQCILLAPIIEGILQELRPVVVKAGHRIKYDRSIDVVIHADPRAIRGILRNLISNAIFYMPHPGLITITIAVHGDMVQVGVSDEGVGIPPEDKERIFNEFCRTDSGKRLKRDGSGIGLSIVKRLVERSGGKIWVESPGKDKGSTFYFTIPLCQKGRK